MHRPTSLVYYEVRTFIKERPKALNSLLQLLSIHGGQWTLVVLFIDARSMPLVDVSECSTKHDIGDYVS